MALSIYTAVELSKLPFIEEINFLKKEVDGLRPLINETEQKILQKFRLDWNYHSNAIEGNQLTYGETVAFIMEGVTAKGKTLKDHLDIKGHDEAVKYLLDLIKSKDYEINEAEIRNLHKLILKESYSVDAQTPDGELTKRLIQIGQYKSAPNYVKTATGEMHYYASVEETKPRMSDLMDWYKEAKANTEVHPIVLATLFHHEFTSIHPFDDGNGRMGRLLMNLMLLQHDYTPVVVKQNDRLAYYQVLRQADAGEIIPITQYMSELLKHSLSIYIKGAKGENIEEEDDIDKEIALFRKSVTSQISSYQSSLKNNFNIKFLLEEQIIPFVEKLNFTTKKVEDLFIQKHEVVNITFKEIDNLITTNGLKSISDFKKSIEFYTVDEILKIDSVTFSKLLLNLKEYPSIINSGFTVIVDLSETECIVKSTRNSKEIKFSYGQTNTSITKMLFDFEKEVSSFLINDLKEKISNFN